jgi:hypothetical protein
MDARWARLLAHIQTLDGGTDAIVAERSGFAEVVELAASLNRVQQARGDGR